MHLDTTWLQHKGSVMRPSDSRAFIGLRQERESGQALREPCYRDATIAVDIYMKAQEDCSNPDALRREVKDRKRASRSWSNPAGPSPLFTMIYSDAAEPIVYDVIPPRKIL